MIVTVAHIVDTNRDGDAVQEPDENLTVKHTMVFECLAAGECNMAGF